MIIELFPVACLSAHNRPFSVLKISFYFSLFLTSNILLYLLMYLCKDFVLSVIIS